MRSDGSYPRLPLFPSSVPLPNLKLDINVLRQRDFWAFLFSWRKCPGEISGGCALRVTGVRVSEPGPVFRRWSTRPPSAQRPEDPRRPQMTVVPKETICPHFPPETVPAAVRPGSHRCCLLISLSELSPDCGLPREGVSGSEPLSRIKLQSSARSLDIISTAVSFRPLTRILHPLPGPEHVAQAAWHLG